METRNCGDQFGVCGDCVQADCEAKPTTLERPSPGDGFENHMYLLEP